VIRKQVRRELQGKSFLEEKSERYGGREIFGGPKASSLKRRGELPSGRGRRTLSSAGITEGNGLERGGVFPDQVSRGSRLERDKEGGSNSLSRRRTSNTPERPRERLKNLLLKSSA